MRHAGARRHPIRIALRLLPLVVLAGCATHSYRQQRFGGVPYDGYDPNAPTSRYAPSRYYPPPGPPSDPWGPYIREAASRYSVPEQWIRAVMRQESGGREQAVSPVGAMGLMQVMPSTYEELRRRHHLGADPYDPHNNILAGVAYIREMYDQFGAPGFLAAYNAGPERLNSYLAGTADLPRETVNYLAAITPNLGNQVAFSGPLAVYAANGRTSYARLAPTTASFAAGCNVDAAYDPDRPCRPLERQARQPAPQAPVLVASARPIAPAVAGSACDLDAAYDPNQPCVPLPASAYALPPREAEEAPAARSAPPPMHVLVPPPAANVAEGAAFGSPIGAGWAIQVGAFANPGLARAVAEGARAEAPAQLRSAALSFPPTTPFGGNILYRARLVHLTASAAASACQQLNHRQLPCIVVPPTAS